MESSSQSIPGTPSKRVRFNHMTDKDVVESLKANPLADSPDEPTQHALGAASSETCETPPANLGPMRSCFRLKIAQVPFPVIAEVQSDGTTFSEAYLQSAQHSGEHADTPEWSPISQHGFTRVEIPTTQHDLEYYSAPYLHPQRDSFDSSDAIEDVTERYMPSASPQDNTHQRLFPGVTTTAIPVEAKGTLISSTFTRPNALSAQASTPPSSRQSFLFGSLSEDLVRGQDSEYFEKIKRNAYTNAIQPRDRSPTIPTPQNATEARDLLKLGRYNKSRASPDIHLGELEVVLLELQKRLAKIKIMCRTAEIALSSSAYTSVNWIVENDRPDIKRALKEDTAVSLNEFTDQVEQWDKAVGHQAILIKLMLYKDQVGELQKKIQKVKMAEAAQSKRAIAESGTSEGREEWKGHKTRMGRRFKGLIEKE